jgi:hypothetical protein
VANELRIYQNFIGGRLDTLLASGGGTMSSPGLVSLSVVDTTNHMMITLDPDGVFGPPELVMVTAHTSVTATASIDRGEEGTTARDHPAGTSWNHGIVASDILTLRGVGDPEGVITAPVGTLFSRLDGGAGTSLYVKESGTGNTGWDAK